MTFIDLFIGPLALAVVTFWVASRANTWASPGTVGLLLPAFFVRVVGAVGLGLVYQLYYGSGDTLGYSVHGSQVVTKALFTEPATGLRLLFGSATDYTGVYHWAKQMWYFGDPPSYFVVRVATVLGLPFGGTYTGTAIMFALVSFAASWRMFMALHRLFPHLKVALAIFVLFLPSVFFWGSGIMKDTLTLTGIFWIVSSLFRWLLLGHHWVRELLVAVVGFFLVAEIRVYLVLTLLPAMSLMIALHYSGQIPNAILRWLVAPAIGLGLLFGASQGALSFVADSDKYAADKLLETAEVTAVDNSQWTVRKDGSAYDLGVSSYTPVGLLPVVPSAIFVTLYRPFLWEANSIVMASAAIEATVLLLVTVLLALRGWPHLRAHVPHKRTVVVFCLVFSIILAFALGLSSGNFGSLVRYRIPVMPFYLCGVWILFSPPRRAQPTTHLATAAQA